MHPSPERHAGPLVLLAGAQFMLVLDASIVNVALPSIGRDLGLGTDQLAWLVNAYALTFGGLLLAGGRLADVIGRRRMFILGLAVFTTASLVAGLAASPAWMIGARAVQGAGAAMASPAALAIVTTTFPDPAGRHRALGVWGGVAAAGGASGALLGGLLVDLAGWPWIFLVNIPVGVAALLLSARLLVDSRDARSGVRTDFAAALVGTAGMTLMTYALLDAHRVGWVAPSTVSVGVLGGALLVAFVTLERTRPAPLIPRALRRLRLVVGSDIAALFLGMTMIPMFFLLSLHLQRVLGLDPLRAGLATLPLSLTIVVAAGLGSSWVRRTGTRTVLVTGLILTSVGLGWFVTLDAGGSYVGDVLGPSLVVAIGGGLSFVAATTGATMGVDTDHAGAAAGLVNTAQELGGAIGLAVLVSMAGLGGADGKRTDVAANPDVLAAGLRVGFLGAAVLTLVGAMLTAWLLRNQVAQRNGQAIVRL